jgi:hypothetical protein
MLMPPLGELLMAGLGGELNRLALGTVPGLIAVLVCAVGAFVFVAIDDVRPWQRRQS